MISLHPCRVEHVSQVGVEDLVDIMIACVKRGKMIFGVEYNADEVIILGGGCIKVSGPKNIEHALLNVRHLADVLANLNCQPLSGVERFFNGRKPFSGFWRALEGCKQASYLLVDCQSIADAKR